MYNSEQPSPQELPSTRQLIRSTLIAFVSAMVLLVTVVWPAEYGIDPTGIGKAIGLTEMGEIKTQLAQEAEEDRLRGHGQEPTPGPSSSLFDRLGNLLIGSAQASDWQDSLSFTLTPGEGTEVKLVMAKGAKAEFAWTSENGRANYDLHGDGKGNSISYKKGRGVPGAEGTLEAAFDGNHGWFWRNRDKRTITITLNVRGDYSAIKTDK